MNPIVLAVLLVALVGALPSRPEGAGWRYSASGMVAIAFTVSVILQRRRHQV